MTVHYIHRHGKRIEVETIETGAEPRKTVEPWVKMPLGWIAAAAKAAHSPATLVLVELLYASWRAKSLTFPLPNSRLKALGVSRKVKARVLHDLERRRIIVVERPPQKTPIITLIALYLFPGGYRCLFPGGPWSVPRRAIRSPSYYLLFSYFYVLESKARKAEAMVRLE